MLILPLHLFAQDSMGKNAFSFGGYVESYYSYDFNQPIDNNKPGFIYSHNRHNEFNVNIALIKTGYSVERARANLTLAAGTYMNANYASETGVLKNIYEANVGYKLSKKYNLWFDIGILPSHIGFESAISKDCWTLTRSILADNSPYFESGAKITFTTNNSKWIFSALALNGWQRISRVDGNSLVSLGTQVQFRPSDKIVCNYSTFFGSDVPDSIRKYRFFHNFYSIIQFTNRAGVTIGFDVGQQQIKKNSKEKNTWWAPVAIFRFIPGEQVAVAIRTEYYSDPGSIIINSGTTTGIKTFGTSVNADFAPLSNVLIRMEGKLLRNKNKIFQKGGRLTSSAPSLTFSTAITF